jgi:DivIVA domain-containing protein
MQADDVLGARFHPARLRAGYDMGEVDGYLDLIELRLRRGEQKLAALRAHNDDLARGVAPFELTPLVSQTVVHPIEPPVPSPAFTSVTRGHSYAKGEVDDFVDEAESAMATLDARLLAESDRTDLLLERLPAEVRPNYALALDTQSPARTADRGSLVLALVLTAALVVAAVLVLLVI